MQKARWIYALKARLKKSNELTFRSGCSIINIKEKEYHFMTDYNIGVEDMTCRKNRFRRMLAALLCVVLLGSIAMTVGAEEKRVLEWTYYDSIVVYVQTDETRAFTPEDFPEVDCRETMIVQKQTDNDSKDITYTVVLILQQSGDEAMKRAIELIQENPLVSRAERNYKYEQCEHRIILNHQNYVLLVGEMVDIEVEEFISPFTYQKFFGVYVTVDRSKFDDSAQVIQENFAQLGVLEFWADWSSYPKTQKGVPSEDGKYYVAFNPEMTRYELIERIAKHPGIREVEMDWNYHPPGGWYFTETWSIDNKSLASLTLSGGSEKQETASVLCQTATVKALQPGQVTLTYRFNYFETIEQTCKIFVVKNLISGDVTGDGDVNALDALRVLQHAVGKCMLSSKLIDCGDINDDGVIDAEDALMILQKAVGKELSAE